VPKNRVKLLLNMMLVAAQAIPRGGIVEVQGDGPPEAMTFRISARGLNGRISHAVPALLAGHPENGVVDAHGISAVLYGPPRPFQRSRRDHRGRGRRHHRRRPPAAAAMASTTPPAAAAMASTTPPAAAERATAAGHSSL